MSGLLLFALIVLMQKTVCLCSKGQAQEGEAAAAEGAAMDEDHKVCEMVITVGCFGCCVVPLCLCVFSGARGRRSCSRGRRTGKTGSRREG